MSAPAVSTVKTTKSAVNLNVLMAQVVSATPAVTTVIVPVMKWKRKDFLGDHFLEELRNQA